MEDLRPKTVLAAEKSSSGENNSDQFEFWCVKTPGSTETPADRLFFNGKLLPHAFPIHAPPKSLCQSQSTSRSSSIRSKDSLTCSRSNSLNSSNSNSSSARTSFSEACEKKIALRREMMRQSVSSQYQFGSSGRWKLIAAAPTVVNNRSRKVEFREFNSSQKKSVAAKGGDSGSERSWCGRNVWKSFVSSCRECHSIETSTNLNM